MEFAVLVFLRRPEELGDPRGGPLVAAARSEVARRPASSPRTARPAGWRPDATGNELERACKLNGKMGGGAACRSVAAFKRSSSLPLMRECVVGAEARAWPRRASARVGIAADACGGCGRRGLRLGGLRGLVGVSLHPLGALLAKGACRTHGSRPPGLVRVVNDAAPPMRHPATCCMRCLVALSVGVQRGGPPGGQRHCPNAVHESAKMTIYAMRI